MGGDAGSVLPDWVTERPVLLVSGSANPTYENATLRLVLQQQDVKASIEVEAGQVGWQQQRASSGASGQ